MVTDAILIAAVRDVNASGLTATAERVAPLTDGSFEEVVEGLHGLVARGEFVAEDVHDGAFAVTGYRIA